MFSHRWIARPRGRATACPQERRHSRGCAQAVRAVPRCSSCRLAGRRAGPGRSTNRDSPRRGRRPCQMRSRHLIIRVAIIGPRVSVPSLSWQTIVLHVMISIIGNNALNRMVCSPPSHSSRQTVWRSSTPPPAIGYSWPPVPHSSLSSIFLLCAYVERKRQGTARACKRWPFIEETRGLCGWS
jgi:hypothetical protein